MSPAVTPMTEMLSLYRSMHPHGLGRSKTLAKQFRDRPADLAGRFLRSVEEFSSYSNVSQGFHDKPTTFRPHHEIGMARTANLAFRIHTSGVCEVTDTSLAFSY